MDIARLPVAHRPRIRAMAHAVHGQVPVERWLLPRLWCLHLYDYRADLLIDGSVHALVPGAVSLLPPGCRQEYRYHVALARHIYCHFTVPMTGPRRPVPVVLRPDQVPPGFRAAFAAVVQDHQLEPLRAEVRLWELLWGLVESAGRGADAAPDALRSAMARIDEGIGGELSVIALAAAQGCSHNHLTRLFRRHLGTTVVGWIRRRRGERALELLRHGDLPISVIAQRVGIPDPQHFNKTMRSLYGRSPSGLRRLA